MNIELAAVPVADQKTAVARSLEVELGIARLTAELDRAATNCVRLRNALLAAAFSGRLTGESSDLEIAEELSVTAI